MSTQTVTIKSLGAQGDGIATVPKGRSTCPSRCRVKPSRSRR